MENGRSDVVGEVAKNKSLRDFFLPAQSGKIDAEDIRKDDLYTRFLLKILLKRLRERPIDFDGDYLARTLGQQRGHGAAPRTDFKHHVSGIEGKRLQNPGSVPLVVQKMLTEFRAMTADFGFQILDFGFPSPLGAS
jgi:hypothetical protein